MSYTLQYYTEEITGESEAQYVMDFLRAHGGQYKCEVDRKHHRQICGVDAHGRTIYHEWSERVYIISFMLYPHEYEAMMREL